MGKISKNTGAIPIHKLSDLDKYSKNRNNIQLIL